MDKFLRALCVKPVRPELVEGCERIKPFVLLPFFHQRFYRLRQWVVVATC